MTKAVRAEKFREMWFEEERPQNIDEARASENN